MTDTLQQLRQENGKLLQMLQLKEKYLQPAQQRIKEPKHEVNKSKDIAVRMQDLEGRLAACEQHIPMFQQSFKEIMQPMLGSNAGLQAEKPRRLPRLKRSGRGGCSAKSATSVTIKEIISGENATM